MKFQNRFINTFVILVSVIIITSSLFYLYSSKEREYFSEDKVVFIIPSTSRNMNYKDVASCSLMNILYESLKKLDISKYKFIIGIDDDDEFYNKNIDELKATLPDNFHFHFLNNYDKSYVCIVNQLADIAIKQYDAEYLYVFADDLNVYELDYINTFIDWFKKHENLGLGWGIDEGNHRICTHPFLSKKHVNMLGYFYPSAIKNWYCDDWVTLLYEKLNRIVKSDKPVIKNAIVATDTKRYNIVNIEKDKLDNLVNDAAQILSTSVN